MTLIKKTIITVLVLAATVGAGLIMWRTQAAQSEGSKKGPSQEPYILTALSDEDIHIILDNQALMDPDKAISIVDSPESRKAFIKGLTEYLALASKARHEGLADDPNVKVVFQNKAKGLLTDLYLTKAEADGKTIDKITDEQIQTALANPENEAELKAEVAAGAAVQKDTAEKTENPMGISPPLQGGALEKFRKGWARIKILSEMAKADPEFLQQRPTQLRLKLLEAGVLSNSCLAKYWQEKIKATDTEISDYLAAHPEFNVNTKRERAQTILDRIKAGEDFAKLAKEFSEHRSTQENGGLYDENVEGPLPEEVRTAALVLHPGQLADKVIETTKGFEVIQLVSKITKDSGTVLKVNRLLLQKLFEDPDVRRPDIPAPFVPATDIARNAVQKAKRDQFVAETIESEKISMPDDFDYEPTAAMKRIKADRNRLADLIQKDRDKMKAEKEKQKQH